MKGNRSVWRWLVIGILVFVILFVAQAAQSHWHWQSAWSWLQTFGLEFLAIALSPLIALQVSADIERNRDSDNRKLEVLETLMATRHAMLNDDRVRALNKITVLFSDDRKVLAAHDALMTALLKPANPDGTYSQQLQDEWNDAQWNLVSAIAQTLNVTITREEFNRGYLPRAISFAMEQQNLLLETNKSLMSFARKELGLKWDPNWLYRLPPGVGITGAFVQGPPESETQSENPPAAPDLKSTT